MERVCQDRLQSHSDLIAYEGELFEVGLSLPEHPFSPAMRLDELRRMPMCVWRSVEQKELRLPCETVRKIKAEFGPNLLVVDSLLTAHRIRQL